MNKTEEIKLTSLMYVAQGLTQDEATLIKHCTSKFKEQSRVIEITDELMPIERLIKAKNGLVKCFIKLGSVNGQVRWLDEAIESENSVSIRFGHFAFEYLTKMQRHVDFLQKLQYKRRCSILLHDILNMECISEAEVFISIEQLIERLGIAVYYKGRATLLVQRYIEPAVDEINRLGALKIIHEKEESKSCVTGVFFKISRPE